MIGRKEINAVLAARGARMQGDLWCGGSAYGRVTERQAAERAVVIEIDVLPGLVIGLDRFRKNPVVLFNFDYDALPVARSIWERLRENHDDTWTLLTKVQFHLDTELSRDAWKFVLAGALSSWRIGVIPEKWEGDVVEKVDLMTISCEPASEDRDVLINAVAPRNHEMITAPAFIKVIKQKFGDTTSEEIADAMSDPVMPPDCAPYDLDTLVTNSLAAEGNPRAMIFLSDSSSPKRLRWTRWYHKGGCLCVELAGVHDEDGNPVIMEVPHEQYTYALRPHLPHLGMEERE